MVNMDRTGVDLSTRDRPYKYGSRVQGVRKEMLSNGRTSVRSSDTIARPYLTNTGCHRIMIWRDEVFVYIQRIARRWRKGQRTRECQMCIDAIYDLIQVCDSEPRI